LGEEDMESNFYQGGEIHLSEIACEQIFWRYLSNLSVGRIVKGFVQPAEKI